MPDPLFTDGLRAEPATYAISCCFLRSGNDTVIGRIYGPDAATAEARARRIVELLAFGEPDDQWTGHLSDVECRSMLEAVASQLEGEDRILVHASGETEEANIAETVGAIVAERDAAIARAEKAEAERDEQTLRANRLGADLAEAVGRMLDFNVGIGKALGVDVQDERPFTERVRELRRERDEARTEVSRLASVREDMEHGGVNCIQAVEGLAAAEARAEAAERERDELRDHFEDWEASNDKVLSEACPPDERHCGCVPFLRRRIAAAEARVKELEAALRDPCEDCTATEKCGIGIAETWPQPAIDFVCDECIERGAEEGTEDDL